MRKFIARNIGLPLFDALKGKKVGKFYRGFSKLAFADRETIENVQLNKLRQLLQHAYDHVPFYKTRFDEAGFKPEMVTSVKDLERIPPLTRKDLQYDWKNIMAQNYSESDLSKGTSSGSTGEPVVYFKDVVGSSAGQGANFVGWELSGWKLGMKGLHIWGNPTTVKNEWSSPLSKAKTKLYNHYKFPAFQLTGEDQIKKLANLILQGNFDFIDGYTNAIYFLAEYMRKKKIHLNKKLTCVLTTAENLQDFQRTTIEAFLGPVYDSYGCSEINGIAYECQYCGDYHIIDPHVIVEYGDEIDDEGTRELLITDLDNYGFPLIRYQNGDAGIQAAKADDSCRVAFSKMKKVTGRQSDIVRLPGGGTLTVPSFFGSMLLKQVNGIKQYQIVREHKNLLIVRFVKTELFAKEDEKIITKALNEYLNGKIEFEIEYVAEIEMSKNGKFKLLLDKTAGNV